MLRNLFTKILLALILILLALHLATQSVALTNKGSWRRPDFAASVGRASQDQPINGPDVVGVKPGGSIENHTSMRDDLGGIGATSDVQNLDAGLVSSSQDRHSTVISEDAITADLDNPAVPGADLTPMSIPEQSGKTDHENEIDEGENEDSQKVPDLLNDNAFVAKLPCSTLPGADDVVVIIKTGATEVAEKLPVHFMTTLLCFPKSLIFSDYGETYTGHVIHDALSNVNDKIKLDHQDFELWRRLHAQGREGLDASELSTNHRGNNLAPYGNPSNNAWRLDKFKNVPMVNYTIHKYPDTKWFIYTDADTYIMWSNLLAWIQQMDSTRLTYLGSPASIEGQIFGHGGSGYLVSNALMHRAAAAYNDEPEVWDALAESQWAGDCVLGTLFEKLGAPLDWAFPQLQGGDNNVMNFWKTEFNRRIWCYPAVSYHHVPPRTVSSLWHFEREWTNKSSRRINHGDVYKHWYLPQLSHERDDWDNQSELEAQDAEHFSSAWQCRDACRDNSTCMQWSYDGHLCRQHQHTRLGEAKQGVSSGWMLERIEAQVKEIDVCDEGDWILPDPR